MAVAVALLAALMFATGTVAQQRAASSVPDTEAKGVRLLLRLVRNPVWVAGIAGDTAGYVLQAVALGLGSVILVQPLLVSTLLLALPIGALWAGRRLSRADWIWATVLTVGLAVFVRVGEPTEGLETAPLRDWVPAGVVVGVAVAIGLGAAARTRGDARATALGCVTGVLYGALAVLTKSAVEQLGDGIGAVLTSWEVYALAVVALAGTVIQQEAFQAGRLQASLPAITVLEPVVAVLLGIAVLDERLRAAGPEWLLVGGSVLAMLAGTVVLSRAAAEQEAADPARS